MLIENKWVVYDDRNDVYYTGDDCDGKPVMGSLDSRVRVYKSERAAKGAINHIYDVGNEYVTFYWLLKPRYIERMEVPDAPQEDKDEMNEPPIIQNDGAWKVIDSFGRIKYVKKITTASPLFAVLDDNGDLRSFGFNELKAWLWYSDLRRSVGERRIIERGVMK